MSEAQQWRLWYYHFGQELRYQNNKLQGDCPFCDKEDHFGIYTGPQTQKKSPGMFNCYKCGKRGNHFTFMRELYDISTNGIQALASNRSLLPATLTFCGVRINPINGRPIIPAFNTDNKLVNLWQATPNPDKPTSYIVQSALSPCEQQLWRIETIKQAETIYICEGHWDAMCLIEVFAHMQIRNGRPVMKGEPNYENEILQQNAVVAKPGSTTFKDKWAFIFKNKNIVLLDDNDKGGEQGIEHMQKVIARSKHKSSSVQRINWTPKDPNDIRDLLNA